MSTKKAKPKRKPIAETGSGNVFADLGFANPDEMLAKAEMVRQINLIIAERGLTQIEAAHLLGVNQPKISALRRGRLTDFSIDRLMRYLVALGQEIDIAVRPANQAGFRVYRAGHA